VARRNARLQPAGGGREKREKRAEHERRKCAQCGRHAPELVQAYIDPRHAGEEEAEPEGEAGPEALPGRRVAPEMHQPRERHERERVKAERRERGDGERAGDKWGETPFMPHDFGLSTSSV